MKPEVAFKAANWWASKLGSRHDNGAKDLSNFMAMALMDALAINNSASSEQIRQFELDLSAELMNTIEDPLFIHCDYSPAPILSKAARKNNIDDILFPYKTGMKIENNTIYVSEGYGEPYKEIYKYEEK